MNKDAPTFSWDDIDRLRATAGLAADEVPPGVTPFTRAQYQKRYHVGKDTARLQLDELVTQGVLVQGKVSRTSSDGKHILVRHYWPTPAKGKGKT